MAFEIYFMNPYPLYQLEHYSLNSWIARVLVSEARQQGSYAPDMIETCFSALGLVSGHTRRGRRGGSRRLQARSRPFFFPSWSILAPSSCNARLHGHGLQVLAELRAFLQVRKGECEDLQPLSRLCQQGERHAPCSAGGAACCLTASTSNLCSICFNKLTP